MLNKNFLISGTMREFLRNTNREFNAEETAALIWNLPKESTLQFKLDALRKLLDDEKCSGELKEQIKERVAFEESKIKFLKNDDSNRHIYRLNFYSDEDDRWLLFHNYKQAAKCAQKYIKCLPQHHAISKQIIFSPEEIAAFLDECKDEEQFWLNFPCDDTTGLFNEKGQLTAVYSDTISSQLDKDISTPAHGFIGSDPKRIPEHRFENDCLPFFEIPFKEGDIAKDLFYGHYVVVASNTDDFAEYTKKILERKNLYDFSDVQIPVFSKYNGSWYHYHVNPLVLEKVPLKKTDLGDIPSVDELRDQEFA